MNKLINYNRSQLVVLVILRVLLGWYFLYEGLAKLLAPGWTSFAYLKDSEGILSDFFIWLADNSTILYVVDIVNIYGLVIIGLSLILGAYVKLVSMGGIALLSMYYLSHPPLIDANYILRTEGAALWVDKNLIMLCAFFVIIYFPTSKLIGLDRYLLKK